jgi:hypothetical protein
MSIIELNIYGDNDEILKTFSTNRVRWGLIVKAVELQDKINGGELSAAEQISFLNDFVLSIFPSMSQNDIELADINDIRNVFKLVSKMSGRINSKN